MNLPAFGPATPTDPFPAKPGERIPLDPSDLGTALALELWRRWRAGDRVYVEELLIQHPEIADDPEGVMDLIYGEYAVRMELGDKPTEEEYLRRFPTYRNQVQEQFRFPHDIDSSQQDSSTQHYTPSTFFTDIPGAFPRVAGYEIFEELGRGGMGVVYRARHLKLNRIVALKMIRSGEIAQHEEIDRLRREAEAIARLHHPNIVQIFEIGDHEGRPFLCLEYVEGGSFSRFLQSKPQPAPSAAHYLECLARAVQAAHEQGIVHRDLKPGNILVASDGTVKITDFGLARQLDPDHSAQTPSGAVLGTPSYMSPEQARGQSDQAGPPADIYALGAILYEVLTGIPPFRGSSYLETLQLVSTEEPLPPKKIQPGIPRDLETICLKCLEKEPQRRYLTALMLAEDLHRFQAGEPILARSVGVWEYGLKWMRRRPSLASAIGLGVLASIVMLILGISYLAEYYQNVKARAELAEKSLYEIHRLEGQRHETKRYLADADDAIQAKDWLGSKQFLEKVLIAASTEPDLENDRHEARLRLTSVEYQLQIRRQRQQFLELRDEAILYSIQITGMDRLQCIERTRQVTRTALELYDLSVSKPSNQPRGLAEFEESERTSMLEHLYEMYWLYAEAAMDLIPGESKKEQAKRAALALENAEKLRTPSLGILRRHAQILEDAGYPEEAQRKRDPSPKEEIASEQFLDRFLAGEAAYRRGDWFEAIQSFDRALRSAPGHFWSRFLLGVCYYRAQRPEEAALSLGPCIERRPDFVWSYLLRGLAYAESGQRLIVGDPTKAKAAKDSFSAAEADFAQAEKRSHHDDAEYVLRVNRGLSRIWQGQLDSAVADLNLAIALKPKQYQAYLSLGEAYRRMGDLPKAGLQFDQAIALEPQSASLHRTRAHWYAQRNELVACLADLEQAIEFGVNKTDLAIDHKERGLVLARLGRTSEALLAYQNALKLRPDYLLVLKLCAETYASLGNYKEVVETANAYFTHVPAPSEQDANLYRLRGIARAKSDDLNSAIEDFTCSLALKADPAAYAFRGWLYVVSEAPNLALKDFDKALHLQPNFGDALSGRAYCYARLGQSKAAETAAEIALKSEHPDARFFYNLARTYAFLAKTSTISTLSEVQMRDTRWRWRRTAVDMLRNALHHLNKEAEKQHFWRQYVQNDPHFVILRDEAAFITLSIDYRGVSK